MATGQLPPELLSSLQEAKGFSLSAFEQAHAGHHSLTSLRLNPAKWKGRAPSLDKVPWSQYGYYLAERPSFTFDPLFHAGTYYVQEASSMFIEQVFTQLDELARPLKVLDLCAAPGGKSTHLQSLLPSGSLLVSNEVIRPRATILKDNVIKWGSENVVVTHNDPAHFTGLTNYFDVILIDAPCSGSGLFRRDPDAIAEWSLRNVELCSQRQQRIVADVLPALKEGGILIYATCSFSKQEDEDILQWIQSQWRLEPCLLNIPDDWHIVVSEGGYRFWPYALKGEGFFMAALRKPGDSAQPTGNLRTRNKLLIPTKEELRLLDKWMDTRAHRFVKHKESVYAWRPDLLDDFSFLLEKLHVIYSGVLLGDLVRDKLVPAHSLAMSTIFHDRVPIIELDHVHAIKFLQRKDLVPASDWPLGWQLAAFQNHPLGWINVLPNRINNYYPKELRILKEKES